MREEQATKKEQIQGVIIAILSIIIVMGGAFFASELKYCKVEELRELDAIGITNFTTLLNDEAPSIIYLARPDCGYCQQQKPIVKTVMNEYDLNIFYLNTNELTSDNFEYIFSLDKKLFGENGEDFGTPTILIVQKGKIIDSSVGLTQKESLVSLFTKHGFIK